MNIFAQSVTRLRAVRDRDDTGALVPQSDWSSASQVVIGGVSVQPALTSEVRNAAGVQSTEEWLVFSPRGVVLDLVVGDRCQWQGTVFDVVGVPQSWPGHHSEVRLRKQPVTMLTATGVAAVLQQGLTGAVNAQEPYTP